MGKLLCAQGPEAHRHDQPDDTSDLGLGAIWSCNCGKLFVLRDSQKDGRYWASDLTDNQKRWVSQMPGKPRGA